MEEEICENCKFLLGGEQYQGMFVRNKNEIKLLYLKPNSKIKRHFNRIKDSVVLVQTANGKNYLLFSARDLDNSNIEIINSKNIFGDCIEYKINFAYILELKGDEYGFVSKRDKVIIDDESISALKYNQIKLSFDILGDFCRFYRYDENYVNKEKIIGNRDTNIEYGDCNYNIKLTEILTGDNLCDYNEILVPKKDVFEPDFQKMKVLNNRVKKYIEKIKKEKEIEFTLPLLRKDFQFIITKKDNFFDYITEIIDLVSDFKLLFSLMVNGYVKINSIVLLNKKPEKRREGTLIYNQNIPKDYKLKKINERDIDFKEFSDNYSKIISSWFEIRKEKIELFESAEYIDNANKAKSAEDYFCRLYSILEIIANKNNKGNKGLLSIFKKQANNNVENFLKKLKSESRYQDIVPELEEEFNKIKNQLKKEIKEVQVYDFRKKLEGKDKTFCIAELVLDYLGKYQNEGKDFITNAFKKYNPNFSTEISTANISFIAKFLNDLRNYLMHYTEGRLSKTYHPIKNTMFFYNLIFLLKIAVSCEMLKKIGFSNSVTNKFFNKYHYYYW